MAPTNYHLLPTVDPQVVDGQHKSKALAFPSKVSELTPEAVTSSADKPCRSVRVKKFLLGAVIMLITLTAARTIGGTMRMRCGSSWTGSHKSKLPTHFKLPSGDQIPSVALGVWKAQRNEVGDAVKTALKQGYRHIDGAWVYRNEEEVGRALKDSSVNRKDVWLTSKLWNNFHAPEDVEPALDESLAKLGTDYVDLYLIHWPIAFQRDNNDYDKVLTADPYPTWQKLEELVEKGKVRNIGISNFNVDRVKNLTANPLKIKPAVLQVELNYWNPQPELVKWAKDNHLLLEAYSPLGGDGQVGRSLDAPVVKKIASKLGITPAQVLISWQVQRGVVVLPKSVHAARTEENLQIFKLPDVLFEELEAAASSHPPERTVNPSKSWNLPFDIFDD